MKNMSPAKRKVIFSVWLISVILLLALSVVTAIRQFIFINSSVTAQATITELIVKIDEEDSVSFSPVFTFKDKQGHLHTHHSSSSTNPPIGEIGESIEVFYNPENPELVEINSFFFLWGLSLIFGVLGIIDFVALYFVNRLSKKNQLKKE